MWLLHSMDIYPTQPKHIAKIEKPYAPKPCPQKIGQVAPTKFSQKLRPTLWPASTEWWESPRWDPSICMWLYCRKGLLTENKCLIGITKRLTSSLQRQDPLLGILSTFIVGFNMFNVGVPSGTDHLLSWLFALSQLWRLEKHPFQVSINMCVCSSVGKDFTDHVRWQRLLCKELQCKMEMKYINLQYDRIVSILLVRIFACLPEFQSVSRLNPI